MSVTWGFPLDADLRGVGLQPYHVAFNGSPMRDPNNPSTVDNLVISLAPPTCKYIHSYINN